VERSAASVHTFKRVRQDPISSLLDREDIEDAVKRELEDEECESEPRPKYKRFEKLETHMDVELANPRLQNRKKTLTLSNGKNTHRMQGRKTALLTYEDAVSMTACNKLRSRQPLPLLVAAHAFDVPCGSHYALLKYQAPLDPSSRTSLTVAGYPQTATMYIVICSPLGAMNCPPRVGATSRLLVKRNAEKTRRSSRGSREEEKSLTKPVVEHYRSVFNDLEDLPESAKATRCKLVQSQAPHFGSCGELLSVKSPTGEQCPSLAPEVELACRDLHKDWLQSSQRASTEFEWRVLTYRLEAEMKPFQHCGPSNSQILRLSILTRPCHLESCRVAVPEVVKMEPQVATLSVFGAAPCCSQWSLYLGLTPLATTAFEKRRLRFLEKLKKKQYDETFKGFPLPTEEVPGSYSVPAVPKPQFHMTIPIESFPVPAVTRNFKPPHNSPANEIAIPAVPIRRHPLPTFVPKFERVLPSDLASSSAVAPISVPPPYYLPAAIPAVVVHSASPAYPVSYMKSSSPELYYPVPAACVPEPGFPFVNPTHPQPYEPYVEHPADPAAMATAFELLNLRGQRAIPFVSPSVANLSTSSSSERKGSPTLSQKSESSTESRSESLVAPGLDLLSEQALILQQ